MDWNLLNIRDVKNGVALVSEDNRLHRLFAATVIYVIVFPFFM